MHVPRSLSTFAFVAAEGHEPAHIRVNLHFTLRFQNPDLSSFPLHDPFSPLPILLAVILEPLVAPRLFQLSILSTIDAPTTAPRPVSLEATGNLAVQRFAQT